MEEGALCYGCSVERKAQVYQAFFFSVLPGADEALTFKEEKCEDMNHLALFFSFTIIIPVYKSAKLTVRKNAPPLMCAKHSVGIASSKR